MVGVVICAQAMTILPAGDLAHEEGPVHTGPVPGEFTTDWVETSIACPKCRQRTVRRRTWESSCGGYEDHQFRCTCGETWWIESSDS
jgi:hypothetical protein